VEIASPYEYSIFHSLQINVTKRATKGLTLLASYVWSKTIENTSNATEDNAGPPNPFNLNSARRPADFDQTSRLNLSATYLTPHLGVAGFKNMLLNDWQLNTIISIYSGLPFTILSGTGRSESGIGNDYADQIGNAARPLQRESTARVLQYRRLHVSGHRNFCIRRAAQAVPTHFFGHVRQNHGSL